MGKSKSDRKIIPARVAAKRAEIGIRQVDLVEKINTYIYRHPEEFPERQKFINNTFVSHWESGYRPIPGVYANALAYALGCSLEYIFGEDTIDRSKEPTKTGEMIPYNRIYLFDKQPVFVVFLNNFNLEQWGLVDIKNDEILFLTKRVRLSTTNKKDYNSIIKEVRPLAPYDLGVSGNNCEQQINLKQALIEDRVMIKMKSSDPYVTERYDGMYRHNENKTAFINAEGFVLPYEGINLSYNVYSIGYIDAAERIAYIQQSEEKDKPDTNNNIEDNVITNAKAFSDYISGTNIKNNSDNINNYYFLNDDEDCKEEHDKKDDELIAPAEFKEIKDETNKTNKVENPEKSDKAENDKTSEKLIETKENRKADKTVKEVQKEDIEVAPEPVKVEVVQKPIEVVVAPVRKRGRPKKEQNSFLPEPQPKKSDDLPAQPVKRRGRPKKTQEVQSTESNEAISLQNMSIDDLMKEIQKRMKTQA